MLDQITMEQQANGVPATFQCSTAVTDSIPSGLEDRGYGLDELKQRLFLETLCPPKKLGDHVRGPDNLVGKQDPSEKTDDDNRQQCYVEGIPIQNPCFLV